MLPEDDRTQKEILNRGMQGWPEPDEQPQRTIAYLPATLSFVSALLGFFSFQVYAVLGGGWRWSVVGLIALAAGLCVGGALQSHANRRFDVQR
jgi:hypothetical protein